MSFSITPNPPYLTVVLSDSDLGLTAGVPNEYVFGNVYNINVYSIFSVGDSVFFPKTKAILVTTDDSHNYFELKEDDIIFTEDTEP